MSGGPSRRLFSLPGRRRPPPQPENEAQTPLARWRAARLAALGAGLGTLSHDLRGVLSPALLAAERLQLHADPAVRRSAEVLVRAVDRAMDLLRDELGPLREGLPAAGQGPAALRAVVEGAVPAGLVIQHTLSPELLVAADPELLRLAWASLFALLVLRDARRAALTPDLAGRICSVAVEHDGRPAPSTIADPQALELSIARDLLRACGGTLAEPAGAAMQVTLGLAGGGR